jgi:hypothetical protein
VKVFADLSPNDGIKGLDRGNKLSYNSTGKPYPWLAASVLQTVVPPGNPLTVPLSVIFSVR